MSSRDLKKKAMAKKFWFAREGQPEKWQRQRQIRDYWDFFISFLWLFLFAHLEPKKLDSKFGIDMIDFLYIQEINVTSEIIRKIIVLNWIKSPSTITRKAEGSSEDHNGWISSFCMNKK